MGDFHFQDIEVTPYKSFRHLWPTSNDLAATSDFHFRRVVTLIQQTGKQLMLTYKSPQVTSVINTGLYRYTLNIGLSLTKNVRGVHADACRRRNFDDTPPHK